MSNTDLLLKEIEGLSPAYMGEILDFVGYLKHKSPPPQYEPKTPLAERTYKSLLDMVGSCRGEDTIEKYFARKGAEKAFEDRQYLKRHGGSNA